MIDVWGVIANGLWVLGLSTILAVWSVASYEASRTRRKTRQVLDTFNYALAVDAGLLLFLIGMVTTEDRWWARLLWVALGAVVIAEAVWRIVRRRREGAE